ncbi:hypothetical protein FA95DRAFT_1613433 [Auriscalpium vulgare]|uniref:Uncharacterized protein n=1 Tax=Auriscalpium vulgare TaxID=40419 RepID=A0ACB8R2M6_9AGAM|nr:hypothetical protein FA95DRAFT_1613433 [Auriscalpium vulgare]
MDSAYENDVAMREWMKATIASGRDSLDWTCIPTIPLAVASHRMNHAPHGPPSSTARAATKKALRRGNRSHLSTTCKTSTKSITSVRAYNWHSLLPTPTARSDASPSTNSPLTTPAQLQSLPEESETGASTRSFSEAGAEVTILQLHRKEDHDDSQTSKFSSTQGDTTDHATGHSTDVEDGDFSERTCARSLRAVRIWQAAAQHAADYQSSALIDVELRDRNGGEDVDHHRARAFNASTTALA